MNANKFQVKNYQDTWMQSGEVQMYSYAIPWMKIYFWLDMKKWKQFLIKLNHRLSWFKYPTQMIVEFLLNLLMIVSRYVASIFSHEWEIVIVTLLREFWMYERKLEGGRDNRCYILLVFYLLCIFCYSLLSFGLQCTSIETKYLSILWTGWLCDISEPIRCKRELLAINVGVDNVLDFILVFSLLQ